MEGTYVLGCSGWGGGRGAGGSLKLGEEVEYSSGGRVPSPKPPVKDWWGPSRCIYGARPCCGKDTRPSVKT